MVLEVSIERLSITNDLKAEATKSKRQYANVYNTLLPYAPQAEVECELFFRRIKENICKGIVLLEEQSVYWFHAFNRFLSFYKLPFSKEDHVFLTHLFYEFVFSDHYNSKHISVAIDILLALVERLRLLTRDDLTLDWRKAYNFTVKYCTSKNARIGLRIVPQKIQIDIYSIIPNLSIYFEDGATQQILDKLRPRLCPYCDYEMFKTVRNLDLFLPTLISPSKFDTGWRLWFEEFFDLWQRFRNREWEEMFVSLFSTLADDTIGYIDWSPYAPLVFELLHRNIQNFDDRSMNPVIKWIVAMLGGNNKDIEGHIEQFFTSLEVYYYPQEDGVSQTATNCVQVLSEFTASLVERLSFERYTSEQWFQVVPENCKITDETLEHITKTLLPLLLKAMFTDEFLPLTKIAFHNLALICPQLVLEPLKSTFFSCMETVTEPHRLSPAMECLAAVSRTMIERSDCQYPEEIISILNCCLTAIDINDFEKSLSALHLMQMICVNVSFASDPFKEIAFTFIDRVFHIIDNSDAEVWSKSEGTDTIYIKAEDAALQNAIRYTMAMILVQSSPQVFSVILDKLYSKIYNAIYEPVICGELVSIFCRFCVQVSPQETLEKFFPRFSSEVLRLTEERECLEDDILDKKLVFCLCVLSKLCATRAKYLLPYKDSLMEIIDRGIKFKSRYGYSYISGLIRRILVASTTVTTIDFKCDLENWGKVSDVEKLSIMWSIPSEEDYSFVTEFLDLYLKQQFHCLELWRLNEVKLSKDELKRCLSIVYGCMAGACSSLPPWTSTEVHIPNGFPIPCPQFEVGSKDISFSSGENIRETVANEMRKLIVSLLQHSNGDTEAVLLVIDIYEMLFFSFGAVSDENTWFSDFIEPLKPFLKNNLIQNKKHIRPLLVSKVVKVHQVRLFESQRSAKFTELHYLLMQDLVSLSLNHYEDIRRRAAEVLIQVVHAWPQCKRLAIQELLKIFEKPQKSVEDSEFEGFLDVIGLQRNIANRTLLLNMDWLSTKELWLSILNFEFREKDSVVGSIDIIAWNAENEHEDHSFRFAVSDECYQLALKGWSIGAPLKSQQPSVTELEAALKRSENFYCENIKNYNDLIIELVKAIESHRLHWKYNEIAFCVVMRRIREDVDFPEAAINLLVNNINNEILAIRKRCIDGLAFILQKQKRRHLKKYVPPVDKELLQYKLNTDYLQEEVWHSTLFVEKPFWCFYSWPKDDLFVYEHEDFQPKLNRQYKELSIPERIVYKFFISEQNVESMLYYLTLEENKGEDIFSDSRFNLFKRLARNYGLSVFKHLAPRLASLVFSDYESDQRCAAEILTGIVRGSKHWPLKDVKVLKAFLEPLIETMLDRVIEDTSDDWSVFSRNCFLNRDPRKLHWLMDILLKNAVAANKKTFSNSVTLQYLLEMVTEHKWRSLSVLKYLLSVFESRLADEIRDNRSNTGRLLQKIFAFDVDCFNGTLKDAPKSSQLIEKVIPQLQVYTNEDVTEEQRQECISITKTLFSWIASNVLNNPFTFQPIFFRLLPYFFEFLKETKDDEMQYLTDQIIHLFAVCSTTKESTIAIMEMCDTVLNSKSWKSRLRVSSFLAVQISGNLFQMNEHSIRILTFINRLLDDEYMDVRIDARVALKVAIQNKIVVVDDAFINVYKRKSETEVNNSNESYKLDLVTKHSGVLGLCAIVDSYPFDVPPFLPDVLVYLSQQLNGPLPIRKAIKSTFKSFRETHRDNWVEHSKMFTHDQLVKLQDLLVSPSYYG